MGQLVSKASLDQQKAENQQLQDQLLRSEAELEAKSVVVIGLEADLQIKKNGKEEVRKNQRRVRMEQLWLYAQRKAQERIYQRMSYDFVLQLNVEDLERLCQTNSLPVITGLRWNNQRFFGRSIGVLGTYNVGKTFFLNLFAQLESGEEMLSGFDVHTQGLSARCVEIFDNPFILFDSAGIRSPAEVPEASDDKTVKRIFRLHKQRERAITSMVAALSDFVCLLVGELTWSDQEELVRYCQARWDARQQRPEGYLWVVHNMRHIKRVQELLHAQELIKRHFPDGQQRTFNEDGLSVWWYQSFGLTPARHVLLMDHTSDIGKAHNTGVLKMLRGWAQSLNASGPNHSKDIQPAQFTKLILDTMAQHMKGSIIRNLEGFELVAAQPELVPAAEPVSLHTYNAATAKTVTIHPQVNMPGLKAALGVALNLPPGDIRSIATADGPLDTDDQVAALQKNTYLIVDLENQPVNRASKQMTLNVHSPNLETRSLKILPPTLAEFKTLLSVLFGAAVVSVWTLDGEEQVQVSPDRPPGERPERCPYSKMKDGDYVVLEYDFGKHAPVSSDLIF